MKLSPAMEAALLRIAVYGRIRHWHNYRFTSPPCEMRTFNALLSRGMLYETERRRASSVYELSSLGKATAFSTINKYKRMVSE